MYRENWEPCEKQKNNLKSIGWCALYPNFFRFAYYLTGYHVYFYGWFIKTIKRNLNTLILISLGKLFLKTAYFCRRIRRNILVVDILLECLYRKVLVCLPPYSNFIHHKETHFCLLIIIYQQKTWHSSKYNLAELIIFLWLHNISFIDSQQNNPQKSIDIISIFLSLFFFNRQ